MQTNNVASGLAIINYGLHAFYMCFGIIVLQWQASLWSTTMNLEESSLFILPSLDKMRQIKDADTTYELEEYEDDWGFDKPICDMDVDMQENVDKAVARIAQLRGAAA